MARLPFHFAWLLLLISTWSVSAQPHGATPESSESDWLKAHSTIVVGAYSKGWPPYEMIREGRLEGLALDYLNATSRVLGLQVETRIYPEWDDVLQAACDGKVDVVMNVSLTAQRTRCMVYTDAFQQVQLVVVGRKNDGRLRDDARLGRVRIAVEAGFAMSGLLSEEFPEARQVTASDMSDALQMVVDKRADVFVGNIRSVEWMLREKPQPSLEIVRRIHLPVTQLHFAVPNDRAPLAGALSRALATMPKAQKEEIDRRWLGAPPQGSSAGASLSPADKAWLLGLPRLKLGFAPAGAPVAFADESGRPSGIVGDYVKRFEELGVPFHFDPTQGGWEDVRRRMARGEVDAYIGQVSGAADAVPGWKTSQAFAEIPYVIVMPEDSDPVIDLGDLSGMRVAVVSNIPRIRSALDRKSVQAHVMQASTTSQALMWLDEGKVDAVIGNLALVDRMIRDDYAGRLRVASPAGVNDALALAVSPRYSHLVDLFDQMVSAMSEREKQEIRGAWLTTEYKHGLAWRDLLKVLLPIALVLLTAGGVHAIGHVRLRREVKQRREVELRLEEITDNLPSVVYRLERDEDGKLSFVYVAGDMRALFGIDIEQAVKDERLLFARVHELDRDRLDAAIRRAWADQSDVDVEFRTLSDHGWRWVRSHGVAHRSAEGVLGWNGYWIDVTDAHEQAEALAAAKEAAEVATRAKSSFLATMSHEIRTPMSGVLGMLERMTYTRLDGEQRRFLHAIEGSANVLRQILDDILDFSKIEADAMTLENAPLDVRSLVDDILLLVSDMSHGKGLFLRSHIAADLAGQHSGDSVRIRQILLNLITNAIKFTESGSVSVRVDAVDMDDGTQKVVFQVVDTGIGISRDRQERLFSPFTQADASTTRRYGGTGLGLSICRKLTELMGGTIGLESEPGVGTRVTLEIDLPVLGPKAGDPVLADWVARVSLHDSELAAALSDWLAGLSINTSVDMALINGVIEFVDEKDIVETPATTRTIVVTDDPLHLVGEDGGVGLRLSSNPLIGFEVLRVCRRAINAESRASVLDEAPAQAADAPRHPHRILVAEDHPTNQELIQWRLDQLGYDCDIVADGLQALQALEQGRYDLLITDCQMPNMDGYELTREIRRREQQSGSSRLPVIALTAKVLADEIALSRDAGMDDFLTKPVVLQRLEQSLKRWLPQQVIEPEEAADTPIDIEPLVLLYGSRQVVEKMIQALIDSADEDLGRLERALATNNDVQACEALHRMAGALRIFNEGLADRFDVVMHMVETKGVSSSTDLLTDLQERFQSYLHRLRGAAA